MPKNISVIVPRIYIGDRAAADDEKTLLHYGITHIVRACGTKAKFGHINYHFCTMKDDPEICARTKLKDASAFITAALMKPNTVVLIHCAAGRSRSPLIVMAYLILHCGHTVETAKELVTKMRKQTIFRSAFIEQLRSFLK